MKKLLLASLPALAFLAIPSRAQAFFHIDANFSFVASGSYCLAFGCPPCGGSGGCGGCGGGCGCHVFDGGCGHHCGLFGGCHECGCCG